MDNNTASRLKIAHYVTAGNLPYIQMEEESYRAWFICSTEARRDFRREPKSQSTADMFLSGSLQHSKIFFPREIRYLRRIC